jgi:rhamnose transport system ATP-binding protein
MGVYVRAAQRLRGGRQLNPSPRAVPTGEEAADELAVALRNVHKAFGGVRALRGVDLALRRGEIHALVGENGAGKSTLVRILGGVHQPDEGEVMTDGVEVHLHAPADAHARGVAVIYQEPALFPDLDIAENIYMGRQPRNRLGIDWREMYREVNELLASFGVALDARTPVQGLSVADQQLVEIAKALSLDAQVVVMDEPTAALSSRETEQLFGIVRGLRERGVAVLFISHRLEEVFELADSVTVLRDGEHVITAPASELDTAKLIRHMVGRELGELFPKEAAEISDPVLEVRGLTREGVFRDISFSLRRGEILGLAGLVGAGRTEVARALFGIDRVDSGEILLHGKPRTIGSPAEAVAAGMAFVPEDRQHQGLVLEMAIEQNTTLPILRRLTRLGLIQRRRERAVARKYADRLQVKAAGLEQPATSLSGGNQQKVVLAKWLATDPVILILDEPTRGIDIGTKAEVHRIVSGLAAQGLAILLISSELPEVLAMADRVIVMHEGKLTGEFSHDEADQERIMHAATGQRDGGGPS